MLLTLGQTMPRNRCRVQLRVKGTFSQVHYESPDEPPVLLPFEHRNGFTELVLPALRVGARIFFTPSPDTK